MQDQDKTIISEVTTKKENNTGWKKLKGKKDQM
jgi:hypothetical protein